MSFVLRYYSDCKGTEQAPYVRDDVHFNAVEACARVMIVANAFSGWLLGERRGSLFATIGYQSCYYKECYTKSVPNGENYPRLSQATLKFIHGLVD